MIPPWCGTGVAAGHHAPETGHLVAGFRAKIRGCEPIASWPSCCLLQARGQVTAAEVATELEMSERTARRDLEALGMAGLPVYSQPGRNGGWRLAGGGRTDLSGLNAAEARALFLVAGTSSATPEVKAALRKLVRALPASFRDSAEAAASAVVVDPVGWDTPTRHAARPPEHLDAVQRAVVESEQVRVGLRRARRRDNDAGRASARARDARARRGISSRTPTPACARSASTA